MSIVDVKSVRKTYASGLNALDEVQLQIKKGEILALLGPNGAGKTTLISTICGITEMSSGSISVGGFDIKREFRAARKLIGLVPQELNLEPFETVINTVSFSRGLFGAKKNPAYIEKVLRQLSLWEKRDSRILELSGGMKRRVLIAKALSHEPQVLFLDEPTAGVDVELRRDMWNVVDQLRQNGVTIILTTHYIEEAEAIADRIAVIRSGKILLVEEKSELMQRMGRKTLTIHLAEPVSAIPEGLSEYDVSLQEDGYSIIYGYETGAGTGITRLLRSLSEQGIVMKDLETHQSSLEEIFVGLVAEENA